MAKTLGVHSSVGVFRRKANYTDVKRKICIYCDTWESGGIESFLHNVLTHMDLSCMEIDLVTAWQKQSIFTAPLEKCGVRFIELSGSSHAVIRNLRRFSALLLERQYDVVHLNLFHGLALCYLHAAKRCGVPMRIAHSHNTALRCSRTQLLKRIIHRACRAIFSKDATVSGVGSRDAINGNTSM